MSNQNRLEKGKRKKMIEYIGNIRFFCNFAVQYRSLYFVKNDVNKRDSLVSKSLPVKKNILVTCLFSDENKNSYVLRCEMICVCQFQLASLIYSILC